MSTFKVNKLSITLTIFVLSTLLSLFVFFSIYGNELIVSLIKPKLNNYLKTEVTANKMNFTLLKRFPNASVEFADLTIKNPEVFSKLDSNVFFSKKVFLTISLTKLLLNKQIKIKSIDINDAYLNYSELNGLTNIDEIIKKNENISDNETNLTINQINLRNFEFNYLDDKNTLKLLNEKIQIRDFVIEDSVSFQIETKGKVADYAYDKKKYLHNESYKFEGKLIAEGQLLYSTGLTFNLFNSPGEIKFYLDSENDQLSFLKVDMVNAKMDRLIQIIDVDLPNDLDIRNLTINLVYTYYYAIRKGTINIRNANNSKIKYYSNEMQVISDIVYKMPENQLEIKNLSLFNKYDTLQLNGKMINNQIYQFNFRFNYGISELKPVLLKLIVNPTGRVKGKLQLKGVLDSLSLKNILALNPIGIIEFDDVGFLLKDNYDFKNVSGLIKIDNTLKVEEFHGILNKSVLLVNGNIGNWETLFGLEDKMVDLRLNIKASKFKYKLADTLKNQSNKKNYFFTFPDLIKGDIHLSVDSIFIDKFSGSGLVGNFSYESGMLNLKNLDINAFAGHAACSAVIIQKLDSSFVLKSQFKLENINISKSFETFNNFNQSAITSNNISGNASGNIGFDANLSSTLHVIQNQYKSIIDMKIDNGIISNFKPLYQLDKFVDVEYLHQLKFDRIENTLIIDNSSIKIPWMDINSNLMDASITGNYSFNGPYNFRFKLYLSDLLYKEYKSSNPDNKGNFIQESENRFAIFLQATGDSTNSEIKYDFSSQKQTFYDHMKKEKLFLKGLFKKDSLENNKNAKTTFEIDWK